MLENNILKVDSAEAVIDFVNKVEFDNSDKISEMIRNDVEMFFDIELTLRKLKQLSDDSDVNEEIDVVRCLIFELHQNLIDLYIQDIGHQQNVNEIFSDDILIHNVITENRELFKNGC